MTRSIRAWLKPAGVLPNEDGAIMIAALLILVTLTVIGIAAMQTSNTEVQIAGHEVAYLQNFYRAEGAAMEAVKKLADEGNLKDEPPNWLEQTVDVITDADIQDNSLWQGTGSLTPEPSTLEDTQIIAVNGGIARGTSLDMGNSKVHIYSVYGRCAPPKKGATVVQLGYKIAY